MAKKDNWMPQVGAWSFVLGLVIAILAGLFSGAGNATAITVLGILGLIVGLLNIGDKEVVLFLLANLAFITAASALNSVLGLIPAIGAYVAPILGYIVVFVAPAAGIVALKALYEVAQAD